MNHNRGSLNVGVCDKNINNGCISISFLEAFFASSASKWKIASPTVFGSLRLEKATYNAQKKNVTICA